MPFDERTGGGVDRWDPLESCYARMPGSPRVLRRSSGALTGDVQRALLRDRLGRSVARDPHHERCITTMLPRGRNGDRIGRWRPGAVAHASANSAEERAQALGVTKIHLMVSHDGNYAVANVILETA